MTKVGTWFVGLAVVLAGGCGSGDASSSTTNGSAANGSAGGEATQNRGSFRQIAVEDVSRQLGRSREEFAVYDANARETYDAQHVPGATWVDYDGVTAAQLPPQHDALLVFYCANEMCSASHTAAEQAIELGYSNVTVMGAGIEGWVAAGNDVEGAGAPTVAN